MIDSEIKKCTYSNSKQKYVCEEDALDDGGFCFWHSDIAKDEYELKKYCGEHSELGAKLCQYNHNLGEYLKAQSDAGVRFVDYMLKGAHLRGADLSNTDLRYVNFSGADFRGANMHGAKLCGSNLEHALLTRVDLDDADLRGANLEQADVRWSTLQRVSMSGTHLEWADLRWCNLIDANIFNANLCNVDFDHANLNYAKLSPYKFASSILAKAKWGKFYRFGHYNKKTTFLGVNTNYINWANNRELKRYIIKQQFIDGFIKRSKINKYLWSPLWKMSCDYGNSIFRWLVTAFIVVMTFAIIFSLGSGVTPAAIHGHEQMYSDGLTPNLLVSSAFNWFTPAYFSVVTFTTLGFGDVVPLNFSAQLFVSLEVISGYFMLGGLMTIFAEKFIIRE